MIHYGWTNIQSGDELSEEILGVKNSLIKGKPLATSSWQSQGDSRHPEMQPIELENVIIELSIPDFITPLQLLIRPNLPWAEDHFQERVSETPYNPPPSSSWWPYAQVNNAEHKHGEIFSHTYPERIWPKTVGSGGRDSRKPKGLRYTLGDLNDLVNLLRKDPLTRQAYLPIWYPEDTGAAQGQRVPCTLGYHFRFREGKLHVNYYMRSCDIMRHMVDDLYLAARLGQWVRNQFSFPGLPIIPMGTLTAFFTSLHLFTGDIPIVQNQTKQWEKQPKEFTHAAR